jgi:cobalamin biosynthesis Mg chelatase CobN
MASPKLASALLALCLVAGSGFATEASADNAKNSPSQSAATQASPVAPANASTTSASEQARQPNAAQSTQPDSPAPSARNNGRAVDEAGRPFPVNKDSAHRPPDESLFTPLAAIADVLGISALLAHLGLEGQVASAVGGILIIALLILLVFLVWWNLMRRYHVTEMHHRQRR